jgi:hypothetical protein
MSNLPGVIRSSVTSKTKVSGVPEPVNKGVSVSLKFAFPDYSGVQLRTSSCQFQALQISGKQGCHVWRTSASFRKVVRH